MRPPTVPSPISTPFETPVGTVPSPAGAVVVGGVPELEVAGRIAPNDVDPARDGDAVWESALVLELPAGGAVVFGLGRASDDVCAGGGGLAWVEVAGSFVREAGGGLPEGSSVGPGPGAGRFSR